MLYEKRITASALFALICFIKNLNLIFYLLVDEIALDLDVTSSRHAEMDSVGGDLVGGPEWTRD